MRFLLVLGTMAIGVLSTLAQAPQPGFPPGHAAPPPTYGDWQPPQAGPLGSAFGKRVEVVGAVPERTVLMANPLRVTEIDGKPLAQPIIISIRRGHFEPGKTYRVAGYQTGEFISTPEWTIGAGRPQPQQFFAFMPCIAMVQMAPVATPPPPGIASIVLPAWQPPQAGPLGPAFGAKVELEGTTVPPQGHTPGGMENPLWVTKVNGQPLPQPFFFTIRNCNLDPGKAYHLIGYQAGGFVGEPGWAIDRSRPMFGPAGFFFLPYLVTTQIVAVQ